jgi:isocitrate dehydrogenase (NAD+)
MAPGANIGPDAAIFEAVHGSAPDIAGKGIANPLALLLAVGLMLEHIDRPELANRLRAAIDQVLRKDEIRTPDLGRQGIDHRLHAKHHPPDQLVGRQR